MIKNKLLLIFILIVALGVIAFFVRPDKTQKDVAEKIFHGFSKQIKETFVTGPSSKFPNQKVGLKHEVKDQDTVEFFTE